MILQFKQNRVRFFGAVILLSLIIQAVQFNLEKSLYADSSFYIFRILNEEIIPVEHNRFAGAITSLPAYLGLRIGLNPAKIFKLYSMGLWLFALGIFSLLVYLKKEVEALTLVISLLWFTRESFFISTKVPTALIFSLLFSAYLWWNKELFPKKYFQNLIGIIGVLGAVFSHPIGLVLLVFLLLWKITQDWKFDKSLLEPIGLLSIVILIRYLVLPTTSYEKGFFTEAILDLSWLGNIRELYSVHFFFRAHYGMYIMLVILWILSLLRLNNHQNKYSFYFYLLFFPILWILIMGVFKEGDIHPMMEKNFLVLVLPVVYVFIFINYKMYGRIGTMMNLVIWFISISSIGNIMDSGKQVYSKRLYELDKIVNHEMKTGNDKMFIKDEKLQSDLWVTKWAFPFETLLMSLNKTGEGKFTIKNIESDFPYELQKNRFYGPIFFYPPTVDSLNTKFFKLSDSEWTEITDYPY